MTNPEKMFQVKCCFERHGKFALRVGQVLALILVWQATDSPLMGQFGSRVQQFPQVVFNAGSTTSFNIHNPSSTEAISVTVQLYSRQGDPLADEQVELLPGATEMVVFGEAQLPIAIGWAELGSDDEFIATEFFQLIAGGPRVGVLPSPASEEIRFFGFVNSQFKSGLALHNPSETDAAQFTVRVKDTAGQQPVNEKTLTLDPLQSEAAFLNEDLLFGSALNSFEGVVEISVGISSIDGRPSPPVAVLSLIQDSRGAVATVAVEVLTHIITGETNTAIGRSALVSTTTGGLNTASGVNALASNTEGGGNTASGAFALSTNTEGSANTANGAGALFNNTTGEFNTASGFAALDANTEGDSNTASGANALFSNTTGSANTASGRDALRSNATGDNNTAFGSRALRSNTEGLGNTASGAGALESNGTGSNNTATGNSALFSNRNADSNTANGASALRDNTSGSDNTAVGSSALPRNTTGSRNTAVGSGALDFNSDGSFNTASGAGALRSNGGNRNTAVGSNSLGSSSGNSNTAVGAGALSLLFGGDFNTAIGAGADLIEDISMTNATAIGAGAIVSSSNSIRLGNSVVSSISAAVGLTVSSDKTKKENFQTVDGEEVLRKLRSLEIPSWNFIGQDPAKFRHYGPMGQDFFAAFGHDGVGTIASPTTINTNDLAGILMIAVQALEKRTVMLDQRTTENAELKARIERLEQAILQGMTQNE